MSLFFSNEITEKGDNSATFYQIDLSKLSLETSNRGVQDNGDVTDTYVVAEDTLNIYYIKGEKIDKKYYFSLTEKLTGNKKISSANEVDTSNITIADVSGAIKITKNTTNWTNNLEVTVNINKAADETLKYMLVGQDITSNVTRRVRSTFVL